MADTARAIMAKAESGGCHLLLPIDGRVARRFEAGAPSDVVPIELVPEDAMILDIGPGSAEQIGDLVTDCRTLVWNGPLGAFEMTPFDRGTMVAAKHAAERTRAKKLISVAGGGDTVAALNQAGVADDFSYVSTAGGAFLEWMEGKPLPGVEVLKLR
jgi:phosphoglycerate kinase